MKLGERLTVKLCVQAGLCASACSSRRHVGSWGNPSPTAQQRRGLGTLTHLLDGGLQGDVQVVHPRQLHRLVNALGCQRVSSEDGVGVPGKQHRVIFVSPVQQGKKRKRILFLGACPWDGETRDQARCFATGGPEPPGPEPTVQRVSEIPQTATLPPPPARQAESTRTVLPLCCRFVLCPLQGLFLQ